ncbi:hypothetical protein PsorP6_006902 [Peronosclerospora sorghi]|uniref:Uncharacterized protein n=1 Tax=Peronosclerospora sorghi TaxID=230839 RepID=A0ACC0WCC8_9STRA|nr:hypothetical protein PsorP6_006902 [Peronosclerospora sorghi]
MGHAVWMFVSSAFENVTGSFQLGFRESIVNTSSCNSRLGVTLAGRGVGKKVSSCTRSPTLLLPRRSVLRWPAHGTENHSRTCLSVNRASAAASTL